MAWKSQELTDQARRRYRAAWGTVLLGSLLFVATGAQSSQDAAGQLEATDKALEKWYETRKAIARESRDWKDAKDALTTRIELVRREIEKVNARIATAEASIKETESAQQELAADDQRLTAAMGVLEDVVGGLETQTREVLQRMPPPLVEHVRAISQQIPEDGAEEDDLPSISVRFRNVAGIMIEAGKFNTLITATTGRHKLSNGELAEVSEFYIGLGQSYYVSANGEFAGVGTATPNGWEWTSIDSAAAEVALAAAIIDGDPAAFVPLPTRIVTSTHTAARAEEESSGADESGADETGSEEGEE